jgi:hypothetical protein
VHATCSLPVSIARVPRVAGGGTNAFTRGRFLVPSLCGFEDWALFMDGADMLARADLAELWDLRSGAHDVMCVKHDYRTRHSRKYVGTEMEAANSDYFRKNWASLMLIDCGSPSARRLTQAAVAAMPIGALLSLSWAERVGALPPEWNWLVGEQGRNDGAKVAHYTLGIPGFEHYRDADFADEWRASLAAANRGARA